MSTVKIKDVPVSVIYIIAAMIVADAIIASELEVVHIFGLWWSSVVAVAYILLWILAVAGLAILLTSKTDDQTVQNQNHKIKILST